MDANSWLWVAIIAFLVFCCLPMLLMGRRGKHGSHRDTTPPAAGGPRDGTNRP